MNKELKPCPFCGAEAFINDDPTGNGGKPITNGNVALGKLWSVECEECGADGGFHQGRDLAVKLWNTRAERTCVIKSDDSVITYCSSCDAMFALDYFDQKWNYCPNCGAKVMKE